MWLSEHLRQVPKLDPSEAAVEFDGEWRSWSYIDTFIDALPTAIRTAGGAVPCTVAVILRNRPAEYAVIPAVLAAGCTLVTLNPLYGEARLADDVLCTGPSVVIGDRELLGADVLAAVREIGSSALGLGADKDEPFEQLVAADAKREDPSFDATVAVLMATSGTTGTPKRVPLLYESLEASLESVRRHHGGDERSAPELRSGVVVLMTPPVHMAGFYGVLRVLAEGRRAALLERFDVDAWAGAVRRHQPPVVSLVPAAMRMVYDADVPPDLFASTKVVLSGSAPLPASLWRAFEEKYGVAVLVNYGATEFSGGISGWNFDQHERWIASKLGSVGQPHPGVELRVVDESDSVLGVNERGRLEVSSAQIDGNRSWVRTSDIAHIDEDGFLWLHGRSDGVINRGGFKLWPAEVQAVIDTHPFVRESVVVGVADERLGELPVAVVELLPGSPAAVESEILELARVKLAAYQVPAAVVCVDELPRTTSLKVAVGEARKLAATSYAHR